MAWLGNGIAFVHCDVWPLLQIGVDNLLDALPADVLKLSMAYYLASCRADEKRDNERNASARLQACLRRRRVTWRAAPPQLAKVPSWRWPSPRVQGMPR